MNQFEIRTFAPGDETAIVNLWNICGLTVAYNDPLKDIVRKQELGNDWFLVGLVNDRIIASCMGGYDGHRGNINYLAVHPDFQRKGHAAKMVSNLESLLKQAGCPKVNLLVRKSNLQVLEFYDAIGYSDNDCISLGKRLISDL